MKLCTLAFALKKSRQAYSAGQSVESGLSSPVELLESPHIARVLFYEYHSEAWSTSPEVARRMQPESPFDSSHAQAAQALAQRDFCNADSSIRAELLRSAAGVGAQLAAGLLVNGAAGQRVAIYFHDAIRRTF